jgi:hypothetical protein
MFDGHTRAKQRDAGKLEDMLKQLLECVECEEWKSLGDFATEDLCKECLLDEDG